MPTVSQLYEASRGVGPGPAKLALVCIEPNGKPIADPCTAGTRADAGHFDRGADVKHAISEDGSRIYWTDAEVGAGKLYVRLGGSETVQVSDDEAQFWAAAADGSKAIYSEAETLRVFDLASEASNEAIGGFEGLMGASEDAGRIYLVSSEAEAPGATAGKPNLYLYEAGEPPSLAFVATLAGSDVGEGTALSPVDTRPFRHTAQVSADGGAVAFMSAASLTGYDNTDAESGEADAEVFLYRAGPKTLACVSCNPTGVAPAGRVLRDLFWAAARIPVAQNQLHFPRVLSGDGSRLFFESFDPLSPRHQFQPGRLRVGGRRRRQLQRRGPRLRRRPRRLREPDLLGREPAGLRAR